MNRIPPSLRKKIEEAIVKPEYADLGHTEIARQFGVCPNTIRKIRKDLGIQSPSVIRCRSKHGGMRRMRAENLGKPSPALKGMTRFEQFEALLPMAIKMAEQYTDESLKDVDFIKVAKSALFDAVSYFDPTRSQRVKGFATMVIGRRLLQAKQRVNDLEKQRLTYELANATVNLSLVDNIVESAAFPRSACFEIDSTKPLEGPASFPEYSNE